MDPEQILSIGDVLYFYSLKWIYRDKQIPFPYYPGERRDTDRPYSDPFHFKRIEASIRGPPKRYSKEESIMLQRQIPNNKRVFVTYDPRPNARYRLFCFPSAGIRNISICT